MITPTVKMTFTFALASALVVSTVLGRSSSPSSRYVTYETEDKTIKQSDKTALIMDVSDRSSNLKYVMAIQSSSIWEEIKKRSLTLHSPQKLDGTVDENSPEDLTDQKLAQLKQAYNDGLKCVAVDHLIVLKQVKEPFVGGKVSVRTAIIKITQVLSQYTTKYHEDVYQYEAVSESDDQSKVNESVTTIMEDNRELCRIDFKPPKEERFPKNVDGNTVPAAANNNSTVNYNTINNLNINNGTLNSAIINIKPNSEATTDGSAEIESKNRSPNYYDVNADYQSMPLTVNHDTTNEININNGTINSATIEKEPSDIITIAESPEPGTQTTNSSDPNVLIIIAPQAEKADADDDHLPMERTASTCTSTDGLISDESVTKQNDARPKQTRENFEWGSGNSDRNYEPVTTTGDENNMNANDDASGNLEKNNGSLENGGENDQTGETYSKQGIVSVGSSNGGTVVNGYVEDGTLNNGNMVQENINNGTINKGTIFNSNADNGIISVGTVNNGPVNYVKASAYTNNGNQISVDGNDIEQFLSNVNQMYSTIIDRLG